MTSDNTISLQEYKRLKKINAPKRNLRSVAASLAVLRNLAHSKDLYCPPARTEEELQVMCSGWLEAHGIEHYSVSNEGKAARIMGQIYKLMGKTPGVADLVIPVKSGPFGALYIELKMYDNDLSPSQETFLLRMEKAGNAVIVVYSLTQLKVFVREYLEDPNNFVGGI